MRRLSIVLLCAGLIGSAMAAGPAPAADGPDKVIADILSVSGMKASFEHVPKGFTAGFRSTLQEAQAKKGLTVPPDLLQAMEASIGKSLTGQGFIDRVTAAMKADYDDKSYRELLADLSTPAARRAAELEAKDPPSEQERAAFLQKLANNPLPAARIDMIHRLDQATRASELSATVVLSTSKAVLRGLSGANGKCASEGQMARTEEAMAQQMESVKDGYSGAMQTALSYIYRDASDADLEAYVRIYEKESTRHISDVIYGAIVEEYNAASARMGRGITKAVRAKLAATGSHACDETNAAEGANGARLADAASQGAPASGVSPGAAQPSGATEGAAEAPKSSIPLEKRKGGDITECLGVGSKSDKDIAACAEKYRPKKQ